MRGGFGRVKELAGALHWRRPIVQEGVWVGVGQVATAVALIVGTRLLTEYLSPAEFGNLSLLLAVFALSRSVFSVSVGQASLRYYGDLAPSGGMGRLRATASRLLGRVMVLPVVAIVVGGGIYAVARKAPFVPFLCLAALLVADVARSYEWNFLVAARRQKEATLLDILEAVGRPALAIGAILLLGARAPSVVLGYTLSATFGFVAARFALEREGAGRGTADPELHRHLLRYALPLMPMAAMMWISGLSDRFILSVVVDREQLGVYSAAYGLMSAPFLMAQILLDRTLTPPYFLAAGAGDREKERRTFRALVIGTMVVCGAGVLSVFLFRTWIAALFLAAQYRSSARLMPWLALGNALLAMQYVFAKPLYAHKRTLDMLWVYTFGAVVSVIVTIPMAIGLGALGAAVACPIYYLLQMLFTLYQTRERTPAGR